MPTDPAAHRCATGELCEVCKPLQIQCAEALGWTECRDVNGVWFGYEPGALAYDLAVSSKPLPGKEIPQYGKTWCATGELCSRHVSFLARRHPEPNGDELWEAVFDVDGLSMNAFGKTAPEAIARCVVTMKTRGKLNV